jgi:hypothetical protein
LARAGQDDAQSTRITHEFEGFGQLRGAVEVGICAALVPHTISIHLFILSVNSTERLVVNDDSGAARQLDVASFVTSGERLTNRAPQRVHRLTVAH